MRAVTAYQIVRRLQSYYDIELYEDYSGPTDTYIRWGTTITGLEKT